MNTVTTRIKYSMDLAAALALTALTACHPDDIAGTDNGNAEPLPVTIGQIAIDGSSTSSTRTSATASPATRLSTANPDVWETGDLIRVSAAGPDATTQTATYRYNAAAATADVRWTQVDPARTDDPDAAHATGDTYPLYLESLGATGTDAPATTLETWGGSAGWNGSTDYLDQSTPGAYRLNDYLRCPAATRALAGTGVRRTCQLSGTLSHQRVSLVLKVADGGTSSNRLPQDAVLRLHLTDGATTSTLGRRLTAWREGKTDASGTPGSSSYVPATTTFRALVALEDVPGIVLKADDAGSGSATGASATTGTVRPGSVLGEVIYTDRGTRQTQYITYSVTTAPADDKDADGNALIAAGTRITVTATFKDAPYVEPDPDPTPPPTPPTNPDVTITGTATLAPWKDTDLGEVGTEEKQDLLPVTEDDGTVIYEVYTAEGLKEFAELVNGTGSYTSTKNLAANARLMADIDLSSVCGATVGGASGTSWVPIADYKVNSSNAYTGTFDGQEHTIRGLYLYSNSSDHPGLFGSIGTNGKVTRLKVVATKVSGGLHTGVLAAENYGTITGCAAEGDIQESDTGGGLVGNNNGTIISCHATSKVTGKIDDSGNFGGLVGINSGTIIACYTTGKASKGGYTGGFVGNNDGTITACYTTGTASYGAYTGGFAGYNNAAAGITYCFWQKRTDGTSGVGGGSGNGQSSNVITAITGTEPDTWAAVVGKYASPGTSTSGTRTLNAAIHEWNKVSGQGAGTAKYCGYCFEKNLEYQSATETPGVPPLLLTPIKEKK